MNAEGGRMISRKKSGTFLKCRNSKIGQLQPPPKETIRDPQQKKAI